MLYAGDHVSSRLVLVIRVGMIQNNPGMPGPAGTYAHSDEVLVNTIIVLVSTIIVLVSTIIVLVVQS